MENLNEDVINLVCNFLLWSMSAINMFIAYRYWISVDGELRKIQIGLFTSNSFLFAILGGMIFFGNPSRLFVIIGLLPSAFYKLWFVKFLVKPKQINK